MIKMMDIFIIMKMSIMILSSLLVITGTVCYRFRAGGSPDTLAAEELC